MDESKGTGSDVDTATLAEAEDRVSRNRSRRGSISIESIQSGMQNLARSRR